MKKAYWYRYSLSAAAATSSRVFRTAYTPWRKGLSALFNMSAGKVAVAMRQQKIGASFSTKVAVATRQRSLANQTIFILPQCSVGKGGSPIPTPIHFPARGPLLANATNPVNPVNPVKKT